MKRSVKALAALAVALGLLLGACSARTAAPFDPEEATAALLESGAFSVALDELDAALLYDFSGAGLEQDAVVASKAYSASGLTEQVAVLVCDSEDRADQVRSVLETYLADAETTFRDYAPGEVHKLQEAILEQRGSTLLLVVADDSDAARKAAAGL